MGYKDSRKKINENLELLDVAVKRKNKKWIEKDLIHLVSQIALLGRELGIDNNPKKITGQAEKQLKKWYIEKTKKKRKYYDVKRFYREWSKNYDDYNNIAFFLEKKHLKNWFKYKNKKILDLGCGTGRYAIPLAKSNNVTCIDFSRSMLREAKKKAKEKKVKLDFKEADITMVKLKEKYDVILSILVQDHIKNLKPLMKVISNASKEGTELIITNIHPTVTFKAYIRDKKAELVKWKLTDQHHHPLEEYISLLKPKGFELIDHKEMIYTEEDFKKCKEAKDFINKPILAAYKFKCKK